MQVAAAKGFRKDIGVNVTAEYYGGLTIHDAVFTGQVDFAKIMVAPAADARMQGYTRVRCSQHFQRMG